MDDKELSETDRELISRVKSARGKRLLELILKHGAVTTEELKQELDHPPRAARDVAEAGIPLLRTRVKSTIGRNIVQYSLGDITQANRNRLHGRRTFPKRFKRDLINLNGEKCAVCSTPYEERYLQIDHRIPYEIAGDEISDTTGKAARNPDDYMLACGSCNRAKSWSCEHCPNWNDRIIDVCRTCYWARPGNYTHIATMPMRRLEVVWSSKEVEDYDRMELLARMRNVDLPDFVKAILKNAIPD